MSDDDEDEGKSGLTEEFNKSRLAEEFNKSCGSTRLMILVHWDQLLTNLEQNHHQHLLRC